MKVALSMIVKDDSETLMLNRCLTSIAKYVDGIFITITNKPNKKISKIIKAYGGHTSYYKWNNNFSDARNYAMKQIPKEYGYIIWTDVDDVWEGAEKIPQLIKIMDEKKVTSVFMEYNYEIDPKTNKINIHHPRERIIKRGYYNWKGALHETLIPTRKVNNLYYKGTVINHFPTKNSKKENMVRNLIILEAEYKREGKEHDPRTEFYLARQYFDMSKYNKATKLFNDYLKHSGWDEERALARNYLGLISIQKNRMDEAINNFLGAIKEKANRPTWYVNLAYAYSLLEKWAEAEHYARLFVTVPSPKTSTVQVPLDDELHYYLVIYRLAIAKRKMQEAEDAAKALVDRFPESKEFIEKLKTVKRLRQLIEITKGVDRNVKELVKLKEEDKIENLLKFLPSSIEDNAYIAQLRDKYLPPKKWGKKTIVYWAGKSFEEWTPKSIKIGLGGSETAIVQLSKEWVKLGYKVTVYGNCGANEGIYDGVEYLNYYRLNRKDTFDTLIIWRAPWEMDYKWKANKVYLDLHDVPNPMEFTQERLKNIDKIFVKSKFHRNLIPHVPDKKIKIVTNGVDENMFKWNKIKRDKYKFIYSSSYDRGLEWILKYGWKIIKKALPKATLDIYYGWNLFDAVHRNNPERIAWKREMIKLMKQDGIKEYGRVGQGKLIKAKYKANVHYYPTDFEEIDCISVRESALAGCVPMMSNFGALKEKPYGIKISGDIRSEEFHKKFANEAVKLIKTGEIDKYREEGIKLASKETWKEIAKQWI